ncbi:hypothetical protein PsorP6_011989 [Peronosclerospora sorghi]|uniref:Uncharacterized protein n=1 Tax=Peronosclerospora sorghi TaxID=230839 RepID=A0ACC0WJV8_9STRA|nr:hypothetical protein PsorP6_011989 [Peronosclerospora sorghi]
MDGKTILLYDLNERENSLAIAFQTRYGNIVLYQWFGNGYIIAGFSSGYVVVISTHINEIGREQYCAKFHDNSMREIVFNEANGFVATCGDNYIKVVRMSDWKEIAVEYLDGNSTAFSNAASTSGPAGSLSFSSPSDSFGSNSTTGAVHATSVSYENLQWTPHGQILIVSLRNGCLYNFMIHKTAL